MTAEGLVSHNIIDYLRSFPVGSIYVLAPKQYVLCGFNYLLNEDKYAIVIEEKYNQPFIYVTRNGSIIDLDIQSVKIPQQLRQLASTYNWGGARMKILIDYLNNHGIASPIIFKHRRKGVPVRWDESSEYRTWTEFNSSGNRIGISKVCYNAEVGHKAITLGDFAFDLTAKKFGLIKNKEGWYLWNKINHDYVYDDVEPHPFPYEDNPATFTLPVKDFRKLHFSVPSDLRDKMLESSVFKVNGQDYTVETTRPPAYLLRITQSKRHKDRLILKAECNVDGLMIPPSKRPFSFFTVIDNGGASSSLRAKKRKAVLYQAFFDAIAKKTKKARNEIVRDALSSGLFKRRIKREAKNLIEEYLIQFLTDELQLQFYKGRWMLVPVDKQAEALLYAIPFEIFGYRIFDGAIGHDEMLVDKSELFEKLHLLYERLKGHGIELFFDKQPVVAIRWEFEFDATRTSIDWFEIRPEIRCNGRVIDDDTWLQAINKKGVIESDGCIQMLDEHSRTTMSAISEIVGSNKDDKKEIVHVPRLQILDWITLRKNGVRIKLPADDERIIERLMQFQSIEERPIPEGLKAKLRHYQKEGYYWLSFLYENRFGACLADDMGLGKTIQAISLLAGIKEKKTALSVKSYRPHLIVMPPTLLFNWENEIKRFYPEIKTYFYKGKERTAAFDGFDVVLTTYGLVRRDIDMLRDINFDVVIFDEAQAVKNIYADTTGAVRQLKAYFKLALTGTPVENHIGEYYSIMDLVLPGLLGNYDSFQGRIKKEASPFLDTVVRRTKPFVLRRTKGEILKELPPKTETDIYLELTEKQKALYKKTVEEIRSAIDEAYRTKTAMQAKIIALTAILKLRQICLSPRLLIPEIKEPSPKIEFLIEQLQELESEGHSVLVFSQFTSFLDIVEKEVKGNNLNFLRLDGSTLVGKRKKLVEEFQRSVNPSIFLLSLKAGGQGLNLTKASYVFHLDPWWNPAVENQASDRAHRIGQKNKVTIMRLLMKHTVEEKMMELKRRKLRLYKAIMEDSIAGSRLSITKEDFDLLLGA